ncbi:TPA: glycosyltransferase [Streptococcus suis]
MISLIMSTYNGSKYLIEQLDSIRLQTLKPDEIIIRDDCSTDGTFELIKDYISRHSLSNWTVLRNEINLGWKINFSELIKMANGEIIFLCDQDDIWELDKIEKMSSIMDNNPQIQLLASNYTPFYDEDGQKLSLRKDETNNDFSIYRPKTYKYFFYVMRPGCVYGFKKGLIKYLQEYISSEDGHDAFLWRISMLLGSLYLYNASTIRFRRHSSNATRKTQLNIGRQKENILYYNDFIQRMYSFVNNESEKIHPDDLKKYYQFKKWIELRVRLVKNRKILDALKLVRYIKCYYSYRTYLTDIYFFMVKGKED